MVNNKRVGNDLSALRLSKRPLSIWFSRIVSIHGFEEETVARATGQHTIEDETADNEYYNDEEWAKSGDIPKETGVDNSNKESMTTNETEENWNNRDGCKDESIGSTEGELLNIKEKEKYNKEKDDYDEEEYTGNDDEIDTEGSNKEEEKSEEEYSGEENNDNRDGCGDKSMGSTEEDL